MSEFAHDTPRPKLREARERAGLTLLQAGRVIGKTPSQLCKIELGATRLTAWDAVRLAAAYRISVEGFFL